MTLRTAILLAGVAACVPALAQDKPLTFDGASWIWFSADPMPDSNVFPAGAIYFRAAVSLPEKGPVKSADLIITADNLYTVYVNGQLAGESEPDPNAWRRARRFNVAPLLAGGRNVLAVEAINTIPGPAGLLVKLSVSLADGRRVELVSDQPWKCIDREIPNWPQPDFNDKAWQAAHVVGEHGIAPWGRLAVPPVARPAGDKADAERRKAQKAIAALKAAARKGAAPAPRRVEEIAPPADYPWPEAVVFLSDDCSLYRQGRTGSSRDSLTVTIFNPNGSRAFPEHDLPAPIKMGRKLLLLKPARPGSTPRVLLDAGRGAIGSPGVSFDGQWIYVSMAYDGEPFFHIYRLPADGGSPRRLTDGPFHDIDPAELPDGRIVFTSTRIGTFEEYHSPPSRSLFVMNGDGSGIRPLTYTFLFDNEPEVLADGRILFIRTDNFFDRGKVETLLHAVRPDGTGGYTEFGLDLGPEYGRRLRAFNCGSPAPLPDGRVAYVTGSAIAVGRPGCEPGEMQNLPFPAGDVAALPDGRLLCTVPRQAPPAKTPAKTPAKKKPAAQALSYEKLALVDPDGDGGKAVVLFDSPEEPIHSPVYLGPRTRPIRLAEKVDPADAEDFQATGILFCQNVRFTRNTTAGWSHVRAVRVLAGKGLTLRSSHSYIVHAGSEVTELGTVPLAPDGSFAVEVPADTAIAFQAVDAEGRSELNEMSWIYVRPGEARGCLGCHQPRQAAPPAAARMQAMQAPPPRLLGQGEPHRFRGNNAAVTGLMELQFDRYREVAGINRHGWTGDGLATGAAEVAALIARLKEADAGRKISAAQRLAVFRDFTAAGPLAALLRDPVREVRLAAAMALAACGTRDSAAPLLEALNDADPLVAQAAAVALENLTGRAEAFDAFAAPAEGAKRGEAWRRGLQATPWERIERDLIARLDSPDRDVVRRAAVALGHVGGDAARAALRDCAARQRLTNPFPEWRKANHGDAARFNSLSPVNPRTPQAVIRAMGCLKDAQAIPLLAETLRTCGDPAAGNLFLAEAAAEALGRIGTPEAESALLDAFANLKDYYAHTGWYGDHSALIACHAAPVHYFITEALDATGSARAGGIVPHLIRSLPTDTDRALLPGNDDCETLVGRVIRRSGRATEVMETCLAVLGDAQARRNAEIESALGAVHQAWGGKPDPENRAAQVLSLLCRDRAYEPRLRAAFERYRTRDVDIPRLFDTGIPVVTKLPVKHWVCFFLARALGNLACPQSTDALIAALDDPAEAAAGRPDPLGPGVLFLHNDLTPCWRAAAAWALGRIGDRRAAPALLKVIADLNNALDTRYAAAEALERLADPAARDAVRKLAADYPEVSMRRILSKICAENEGGDVFSE